MAQPLDCLGLNVPLQPAGGLISNTIDSPSCQILLNSTPVKPFPKHPAWPLPPLLLHLPFLIPPVHLFVGRPSDHFPELCEAALPHKNRRLCYPGVPGSRLDRHDSIRSRFGVAQSQCLFD